MSDARRPKCRDWILKNVKRLSEARVRDLDAADAKLRLEAQRHGRSHHLATRPATDENGQVVGG